MPRTDPASACTARSWPRRAARRRRRTGSVRTRWPAARQRRAAPGSRRMPRGSGSATGTTLATGGGVRAGSVGPPAGWRRPPRRPGRQGAADGPGGPERIGSVDRASGRVLTRRAVADQVQEVDDLVRFRRSHQDAGGKLPQSEHALVRVGEVGGDLAGWSRRSGRRRWRGRPRMLPVLAGDVVDQVRQRLRRCRGGVVLQPAVRVGGGPAGIEGPSQRRTAEAEHGGAAARTSWWAAAAAPRTVGRAPVRVRRPSGPLAARPARPWPGRRRPAQPAAGGCRPRTRHAPGDQRPGC